MNTTRKSIPVMVNELVEWIRDWFDRNGKNCNAVIGISGGKDSSVVAALCVKALGKDRVIGVLMPNGVQKDIESSRRLCSWLGIKNITVNIKDATDAVVRGLETAGITPSKQTLTNIPARIRMSTLYAVAQSCNGRVSCNCNLAEDVAGYSTRWGDDVGDFAPLRNIQVREVIAIGDYLGLPYELAHKTPVDGLNEDDKGNYVPDEVSLGVTYEEIDDFSERKPVKKESYDKIISMYEKNKFKLSLPAAYVPCSNYILEDTDDDEEI